MKTIIRNPAQITPRLLPGFKIGEGWVSIEYGPVVRDSYGFGPRQSYRYYIDLPNYRYEVDDLRSGCGGGNLQQGLGSLMAFLGAFAESYRYGGESADLFPAGLADWALENEDEFGYLGSLLDEGEGHQRLITEVEEEK